MIFHSVINPYAFCGLKVDSDRKKRKKCVRKPQAFYIDIGSYRDILVENCPLFVDFWPLKSQSHAWVPSNLIHIQPVPATMLCSNFSVPRSAIL